VEIVVEAFAELLKTYPDYRLDIVGDGPARDGLLRLAGRLGIADKVRMPGFMDRAALGRIYRDYDAFVTASTIETQGIVLLEAMTAGLPVVGVRALAIPELIADERDGIIVDPGDPIALSRALERIVGDEGLRERFGQACRADVAPHALDAVVTRLESLYSGVIADGRTDGRPTGTGPGNGGRHGSERLASHPAAGLDEEEHDGE
jgi:glycosyltransferase involved in cell wall biosynthesis